MIQIRSGIFETNSSSVHAMVLCTEEEYWKFAIGALAVNVDDETMTSDINGRWSRTGLDFDKINDSYQCYDEKIGKHFVDAEYKLVELSDGTQVGFIKYEAEY